ncbi:transcription factor 19 [Lepisosteus oculatus]|uniref:transcription factor 19 n=1 Tax=Lepisosteus oculatus TaxID=7918 RepID=UPI0035F50BA2
MEAAVAPVRGRGLGGAGLARVAPARQVSKRFREGERAARRLSRARLCCAPHRAHGHSCPRRRGSMLPGLQPCFQLLRVGASDPGRDLFTFRPALPRCVFRVGRLPELCDVPVSCAERPELVSRVHAELHAEREEEEEEEGQERGWRVFIVDQSSYGTWLNDSLLLRGQRTELRDGDTLTFGAPARGPECYFLFQRALLRPDAFAAIALPRAPAPPAPPAPRRASLVLSSIGSISRLGARPLTFHPAPPAAAAPRRRRKSAHTLLAEPADEPPPARRPCCSESEALPPQTPRPRRRTLSSPQDSGSGGRRRGRPRKRPLAAPEPCAARRCLLPQEDTVQWVQCDDCDAWYHVDCAGCSYSCLLDDAAEFHCGCR